MKKVILTITIVSIFLVPLIGKSYFVLNKNQVSEVEFYNKPIAQFIHSDRIQINKLPTIFEHPNFRGNYSEINVSRPKLSTYGWNDKISSIIVPNNWKIIFYEHSEYCGKSFTVHPGKHNTKEYGWNDKFSSMKVYYKGELQGYAYSCSLKNRKGNCPKCRGDGQIAEGADFGPVDCPKCGGDGDW